MTVGKALEKTEAINLTSQGQHPEKKQGDSQEETGETFRVLKLRQVEVETTGLDVRKQLLTAKALRIEMQGAAGREKVGGNEPGVVTGGITRQGKMDRADMTFAGEDDIGQAVELTRGRRQVLEVDPVPGGQKDG